MILRFSRFVYSFSASIMQHITTDVWWMKQQWTWKLVKQTVYPFFVFDIVLSNQCKHHCTIFYISIDLNICVILHRPWQTHTWKFHLSDTLVKYYISCDRIISLSTKPRTKLVLKKNTLLLANSIKNGFNIWIKWTVRIMKFYIQFNCV